MMAPEMKRSGICAGSKYAQYGKRKRAKHSERPANPQKSASPPKISAIPWDEEDRPYTSR